VTTKIPLEAIPEKQKVYVKGQWLSVKDVSSKYGKHLTATPIEILRWLRERGEPVYFSDFIKELNLNKITAYYTLRKLEAKGLIIRIGKRNPLIGLTEKGYYEIEVATFKIKPSMIDIKDLNSLRMELENVLKMLEIGELDAVINISRNGLRILKLKHIILREHTGLSQQAYQNICSKY
jgi:DNA-binding MarR family transcriptional regulator